MNSYRVFSAFEDEMKNKKLDEVVGLGVVLASSDKQSQVYDPDVEYINCVGPNEFLGTVINVYWRTNGTTVWIHYSDADCIEKRTEADIRTLFVWNGSFYENFCHPMFRISEKRVHGTK